MKHDRRGRGEVADGFGPDVSLRQLDEDIDPDCDRNGREQDQQDGNQPWSEALPGLPRLLNMAASKRSTATAAVHFLSPLIDVMIEGRAVKPPVPFAFPLLGGGVNGARCKRWKARCVRMDHSV